MSFRVYERYNNIVGWLVFAVAAFTYLSTAEPTVSLWDCGEFISAAYKLEVVHPPGAPFFLMLNRIFTMLAPSEDLVGYFVNASSALSSAFAILFLFWTITALARKVVITDEEQIDTAEVVAVLGSGAVGALAYTFSDSFWFSAVEGEVYALSSFFTAIVFWLMLKWERRADNPRSLKWIILIAFLIGLSTGVHLLSLLVIPAMAFVFYFRLYQPTALGVLITIGVALGALAVVQVVYLQILPKLAAQVDLLAVNVLGLPYWSGVLFFIALVLAGFAYAVYYTWQRKKILAHTFFLCAAMAFVGYGTYAMVVIRSQANPPIDMNDPEDIFSMISYLGREQYGSRPLLHGHYFTAQVVDYEDDGPQYRRREGDYVEIGRKRIPVYDPDKQTIFPRMYSTQGGHAQQYRRWTDLSKGEDPSFSDNLKFFWKYQLGHMWWRYFAWNYVGRQNDIQGHGSFYKGNWITGIPFIDGILVGNQNKLPEQAKNDKTRNELYGLPFLLGLLGAFYHFSKSKKDALTVLIFFVMTGIAVAVYLNMPPLQPRERDYAFVGGTYVFAIWVGFGVLALMDWLRKNLSATPAAAAATGIGLLIAPALMASEEWDDHDRSERTTALDFATNYLNSCDSNAVLFTNGDNDTYPLWYAQEVAGIRTDVRVVNLSLLNTDWYVNQMRKDFEQNGSKGLALSFPQKKIVQGTRDYVIFNDKGAVKLKQDKHYQLSKIIDFVMSDARKTKSSTYGGEAINYFPTKKFYVPVDKQKVIESGLVREEEIPMLQDAMRFNVKRRTLMKANLVVLDLLANSNWERPIYFSITTGQDVYLNMMDYFRLEGLTYRVTPVKYGKNQVDGQTGYVDTEQLYDKLMNEFRWGNMDSEEEIFLDNVTMRQCYNLRNLFNRLARHLIADNNNDRAVKVLDYSLDVMPQHNVPYDVFMVPVVELYYAANAPDKAKALGQKLATVLEDDLEYAVSLQRGLQRAYSQEMRRDMYGMNTLARLARKNNQEEFAEELSSRLQALQSKAGIRPGG